MKKENRNRIILFGIILFFFIIYFTVPSVKNGINESIGVLTNKNLDINSIAEYIRGFGVYEVLVSFLLMILQSIIAPIPAFFITLSNAIIWGWWKGAILSWTSSMVGAMMCFIIARVLGRDVVKKFATEGALRSTEKFFEKYGKQAILVARLLPFVPFDPVSYAAGLTAMDFWGFVFATGLGQLPATIIYSYVGEKLSGGAQALMFGLLGLFAISIVIWVGKSIYNDRQKNKEDKIN